VLWQSWSKTGPSIPISSWGLTLPDGDWSNGAGYTSLIVPPETWWWGANPGEVLVHEWLHQAAYWHSKKGLAIADLHAPGAYGYTTDAVVGSYRAWYAGIMRDTLPLNGKAPGISRATWATGTPRSQATATVTRTSNDTAVPPTPLEELALPTR
jgi:hypothetical protein